MPDPAAWSSISDSEARLRHALGEMYAFFRRAEGMLEKTSRDAPLVERSAAAAGGVSRLPDRGRRRDHRRPARARRGAAARARAVGHAVSFPTWQSLVRQQGLDDAEAVAVMAALVESAGGARPTKG